MILEWWQIIVFLVITGLWSEFRNRRGFLMGYIEGAMEESSLNKMTTVKELSAKFDEMTDRAKIEMVIIFKIFFLLERNGILRFDTHGNVFGLNKKPISLHSLDKQMENL